MTKNDKTRRKYGTGSIRFNTCKNAYTVSYKDMCTTCKTQKQAESKLREFKRLMKDVSENERKAAKQRKAKSDLTVIETAEKYRISKYNHRTIRNRSMERETETFNLLAKSTIANIPIQKLTEEMVWNQLIVPYQSSPDPKERRAHSTAKKVFELLHATTRWAAAKKQNILLYDICEEIVFPPKETFIYNIDKAESGSIKFYTVQQQQYIIEECDLLNSNGKRKYYFGPAIKLFLYSGMRVGEGLFLKWKDVDFNNRTVTVSGTVTEYKDPVTKKNIYEEQITPKTKSSFRTIQLTDEAYNAILELKEQNGEYEHVISTTEGKLCSPSNFRRKVYNLIHQIADKDKSILLVEDRVHALRHTFASMEILKYMRNTHNKDISNAILWVSKQLGHSSITVTNDIYNHMFDLYVRSNNIKIFDND